MRSKTVHLFTTMMFMMTGAATLLAQGALTLPPDGDNQRSSVSQGIGLVTVAISYNSPDVHGPRGEDRAGHIWGELVPYGLTNLGFGTCKECPWRAGANENTVFSVSHDVMIEGQRLPAGSYGLMMIAQPEEWTLIFSRSSTSWGSFFYEPAEDALRVKVKPRKSAAYNEWLTYEFIDRKSDQAVAALRWENLEVPWTIKVEDMTGLYLDNMRRELKNAKGFDSGAWTAAADYALKNKRNLEEALRWAEYAVHGVFVGEENFATLSTLARAQEANGKTAEAKKSLDKALNHPLATPIDLYGYGRQLLRDGKTSEALAVAQLNAKRFPKQWPVDLGLMRAYSGLGNNARAIEHGKKALAAAPDEPNRKNIEGLLARLQKGETIN